jgi:hypothetical protein
MKTNTKAEVNEPPTFPNLKELTMSDQLHLSANHKHMLLKLKYDSKLNSGKCSTLQLNKMVGEIGEDTLTRST